MVSLPDGISQCLSVGNPRQMKRDGRTAFFSFTRKPPALTLTNSARELCGTQKAGRTEGRKASRGPKLSCALISVAPLKAMVPKQIYTAEDPAQMFLLVLA